MIKELYQPVEPQSRRPSYVSSSSMASSSSSATNGCQHRHHQKAVVLSAEKWNQLLAKASGTASIRPQTAAVVVTEDGKTLAQKEAEYKQYLKKESQAMTIKWENTVQNIREKKEAEQLRKQREKVEEDEKHYRELKVADEVKRKELIEKAEEMIQKEKEGPRVLESAAKFCEVLKAREYQRKFRSEQEALQEARRRQLDQQDNAQANRWIKSQAERHIDDRKRFDCYKKELKEKIERDHDGQLQVRNFMIAQEQKQHQALTDDTRQQMELEKRMLERNKEMRRKHALEAMKMAQEREERLKREASIEKTLNEIYNDGQRAIAQKRKEIHVNKHRFRDNTHLLQDSVERQKQILEEEEYNRNRALLEQDSKADEKEREALEKKKQDKAARIKAHLEEIAWQKKKEQEQALLERKEMAARLKNVDVTFGFDRRKVTDKTSKTHAQRKLLLDQADEQEEREKREADTRAELQYMRNSAEKENTHFLKYADELISDAKAKGRPVLPLLKTVENYKREHYFDFKEKNFVPRHLVSRVPINNKVADQRLSQSLIPDPAIIEMTPAMPPIWVRYDPEQLKNMNPYKNSKNTQKK
ncbi:calponin homology domain-containing protein DDB_G0272472 [Ochlerotatus camptorhynchus]|uniref:calponin homology domain-containing protein DDB_G0272472 n=1 Tax=Ochlerotatus camptorhynchus TaxID=644619 RepID=UPI0031DC87FF